jgi:polyisoprenoid-binding protein YceI
MSTAAQPEPSTSTWQIDPVHSTAQFKVRHLMISNVKGEFTAIKGTLQLDSSDVTKSTVEAVIDANSINTREPQRDTHLKSADFLEVEKFSTINFKSTRVTKKAGGEFEVEGYLTIHGVTGKVKVDVEAPSAPQKDPWGGTRIGVEASTKINRKDFGLVWNATLESGGFMVGDEVAITLDVQFVRQ